MDEQHELLFRCTILSRLSFYSRLYLWKGVTTLVLINPSTSNGVVIDICAVQVVGAAHRLTVYSHPPIHPFVRYTSFRKHLFVQSTYICQFLPQVMSLLVQRASLLRAELPNSISAEYEVCLPFPLPQCNCLSRRGMSAPMSACCRSLVRMRLGKSVLQRSL